MTEFEIIIGLKDSNPAAYRQLFVSYYTIILKFLDHIIRDGDEAKDIAQDIFMKIWINRSGLDPDRSIKGLLFTMAKNAALNHLKKNGSLHIDIDGPDVAESKSNESEESDLEYLELKTLLRKRIEAMPNQRRRIFTMSRYRQMSNKEIADELGLSVRTVEKHLELALKDIKDIYPA